VGPLEVVVVLIIALVVFGPKRIPELGKSLGKGMRQFKASLDGDDEEEDEQGEPGQLPKPTDGSEARTGGAPSEEIPPGPA
jgi:sec-independent protein translocase protein TatA